MKKTKTLMAIAAVCLLIGSCKKEDTPATTTTTTASLSGTWSGHSPLSDFTLILKDDKSYSYEGKGTGYTLEQGTYTIASPAITFNSSSTIVCSANQIAKYTYSVSATTLSFKKVSDSCDYRVGVMAISFTK